VRVDSAGPRTWLLATVAGWALLAWVLALAGMGGRAALLADDPGLLQSLPQPRPSPPERLGPLGQYAEIGARPLFAEDRRPHPFSLQPANGEEAETNTFDYVLTSVLITPQLHMAIVQPSQGGDSVRIKLGEASEDIPAWRLVELNPRSAVFEGPEGRKALDLRTFDGVGGQSPTEVSAGDPTANAPSTAGTRPSPGSAVQVDADSAAEAAPEPSVPPSMPASAPQPASTEKQMDAIRKRIEARRAQLRQEALQKTAPAKKP
jgi:general secretion pathway protein N